MMGMLKKAASGVLALLPPSGSQTCRSSRRSRSRTTRTLRAPKGLRPCWTGFFEHSLAFCCQGLLGRLFALKRALFNSPIMGNATPFPRTLALGCTLTVLLLPTLSAMGTMYRCFDAQGSVVLTDSPAQLDDCTELDPKKPTAQITPSPNPAQTAPSRARRNRAIMPQRPDRTESTATKDVADQEKESMDPNKEELEAITVPITKIGGSMVVQVTLNGSVDAHLIVDTGATMTVLSYDIGIELGLLSGSDVSLNTVNTAGGSVQVSMSNLESVQVGAAKASNVAVAIHDLPDGISGVSGLLGMSFLKNFEVTLDADQGFLRLLPKSKK